MRLDRERRRTLTQFLNGLAISNIAALVLAPLAAGTLKPAIMIGAIIAAVSLHAVALLVGS